MSLSEQQFRALLSNFATGITIVSCLDAQGQKIGVTINSFSSVSLEPPLVLFSLAHDTYWRYALLAADTLAISMLAVDQTAISNRFAAPGPDHWDGIEAPMTPRGAPLIPGHIGALECQISQQIPAGDHVVVLCQVTELIVGSGAEPLIYFRSTYRNLSAPADRDD